MRSTRIATWLGILALGGLGACLGGTGDTGGETHWRKGWLSGCVSDEGCATGFSCIGNLCTVGCAADEECAAQGGGQCLAVGGDKACAVPERLGCSGVAQPCGADMEGWFCVTGAESACALPIVICEGGTWLAGTLDDCRDTVTRSEPFTPQAAERYETVIGDAPVALDILFVVDNSSSMSGEQRALAVGFERFFVTLSERIDARPRIAATSVDVQCEVGPLIPSARGAFNTKAAAAFPPPGQFNFRAACVEDADCEVASCDVLDMCDDQTGLWSCRTSSETCITNPNGSVNASCRRRCTDDAECREAFADPSYICQKPSANEEDWGCLRPPATGACPEVLPIFVEGDDLALAPCLVSVGANQEKCLKFEQGLGASRLALDPAGPNAAQAAAFMRPEAILAVVYVSDEDDCSVADDKVIGEEDYETCAALATTDEGGPLTPTATYVDFLRGLKPHGRVMTAALVGQSLAVDPADVEADYAAYLASKTDPKVCYHQTSLCQTAATTADWGRRYAEVAAAFGPDGHIENLCTEADDFTAAFEHIAAKIAENAKRICLPKTDTAALVVSLVRDGVETVLAPGVNDTESYTLIDGAAECATGLAVAPARRLVAGDTVRLTYP